MIYESGRESSYIDDIAAGLKTYEGRLNRGKFADYKPGDFVWLRRDKCVDGKLVDGEPKQLLVSIISIAKYPTFREMLAEIGFEKVIPRARDLDAAVAEYSRIYSPEDEASNGVLAIEIKVADPSELTQEDEVI